MQKNTLEYALWEGMQRGYHYILDQYGFSHDIDTYLEELQSHKEQESPKNYILIGEFILNPDEAWQKDPEVYILYF